MKLVNKVIALDATGGDKSPNAIIEGAALSLKNNPSLFFHIFGNERKINPLIKPNCKLYNSSKIFHIEDEECTETSLYSIQSFKKYRKSSLGIAIDSVLSGESQALVSSGDTRIYVSLAKLILKTIEGIKRPALPAIMPTINKDKKVILLDVGANLKCDTENLIQFAIMGKCLALQILKVKNPTIGLLNIGTEELKGGSLLKETLNILNNVKELNFCGFVEGSDILLGKVDVIITNGFSGNLVLKAIEGSANFFHLTLKQFLSDSLRGILGSIIAYPSLKKFKNFLDSRYYNGSILLGIRGVLVKSHGSSDRIGFSNAINIASKVRYGELEESIKREISLIKYILPYKKDFTDHENSL